jgi:periplasmic protein TonB
MRTGDSGEACDPAREKASDAPPEVTLLMPSNREPLPETATPVPAPEESSAPENPPETAVAARQVPRPMAQPLKKSASTKQKTSSPHAKTIMEKELSPFAPVEAPTGDNLPGPTSGNGEAGGGTAEAEGGDGAGKQHEGYHGSGVMEAQFGTPGGPRFLHKAIPIYPRQARQAEKEGTVILHVTIDEQGNPVAVELVKAAGFGFDEEAIQAVRKSKFAPARKDSKPVLCKAILPIRFVLKNAEDE